MMKTIMSLALLLLCCAPVSAQWERRNERGHAVREWTVEYESCGWRTVSYRTEWQRQWRWKYDYYYGYWYKEFRNYPIRVPVKRKVCVPRREIRESVEPVDIDTGRPMRRPEIDRP
jgi:hypothetical protein